MDLPKRVERLERQIAFWRGATLVLIFGYFALSITQMGQAKVEKPKNVGTVLKAPFRIVDERDRTLLFVDTHVVTDEGVKVIVPRLRLFGIHGKPAVELEAMYEGGSLGINDRQGKDTAGLAMGYTGSGLYMSNDLQPGNLSLTNNGLTFSGKGNEGSASLSFQPRGGSLVLDGQDFREAVSLSVDEKGGHLKLRDRTHSTERTFP